MGVNLRAEPVRPEASPQEMVSFEKSGAYKRQESLLYQSQYLILKSNSRPIPLILIRIQRVFNTQLICLKDVDGEFYP